jgi:hypothetical protein
LESFVIMDELGFCPSALRICPTCHNNNYVIVPNLELKGSDKLETWWKTLQCRNCRKEWFVCTTCSMSRKQLITFADLREHFRRHHDDKRVTRKRKSRGKQPAITKDVGEIPEEPSEKEPVQTVRENSTTE